MSGFDPTGQALPRVEPDLFNGEYHAGPGLSSTQLVDLLPPSTPRHFYRKHVTREAGAEESAALLRGRLVHAMVLDPGAGMDEFMVLDVTSRRSQLYQAAERKNPDRTCVLQTEYEQAAQIARAVLNDPRAAQLIEGAQCEHSLFWNEAGILAKCRPDARAPRYSVIADLKTGRDVSPKAFQRAVIQYGYHISAAWYLRGEAAVFGERSATWCWIAVEAEPPHVVQLYVAEPPLLERGDALIDEALARLRVGLESGTWPGFADGILPVGLPGWAA